MISLIVEDLVDVLVERHNLDPLELIHYLYTQHLLEDGVAGEDEYQDALSEAWISCLNAIRIQKKMRLEKFLEVMKKDCGCSM